MHIKASSIDFVSRRSVVLGRRGLVASSQPLASEAGLRILQKGGNAADAAIAVAAALSVTEPCSTGLGGDAFALYYEASTRKVHCFMSNGHSPAKLTMDVVRACCDWEGGRPQLPPTHALTVTVPGAAALWDELVNRHGNLTLEEVLKPAIELAEGGFPVSPITALAWQEGAPLVMAQGGPGVQAFVGPDGRGPQVGEVVFNKDLGATLRAISKQGAYDGFYRGGVAEAIVNAVQSRGGVLELEDLMRHRPAVVDPISTTYRGLKVWETPPPTQGLAALVALAYMDNDRRLEQQQPGSLAWGSAELLHTRIESVKAGFEDALGHIADPDVVEVPVDHLLDRKRLAERHKANFSVTKAFSVAPQAPLAPPQDPKGNDTVYFCVVDGAGNGCSFINSNYMGFGTGIVPEGCGFTLQNRAFNFTMTPGHPNELAPRKRPYHTIIPGLVTDAEGQLFMTFGVMGGFMQPQGHLQVVSNIVDYQLDPQAALDAPRFCISGVDSNVGPASLLDAVVLLEEGIDPEVVQELQAMGHKVQAGVSGVDRSVFGRGQIILRDAASGVLWGGCDPRSDGIALGW